MGCSAYEEAIGYMVSRDIRDKDGVSVAIECAHPRVLLM